MTIVAHISWYFTFSVHDLLISMFELVLWSHVHFTCSMVWRNWWLSLKLFNRIVLIDCLTRITRSVILCYLSISNHTTMFSSRFSIWNIMEITVEWWCLIVSCSFEEISTSIPVLNCTQTILNIKVRSCCCRIVEITRCSMETVTYSCAYVNWVTCISYNFLLVKGHLIMNVWSIMIELSVCFTT